MLRASDVGGLRAFDLGKPSVGRSHRRLRGGTDMGVGTSIVLIAVGAILRFAVSVTTTGFNIHSIGIILMIVGVLGLLLSMVFWSSWGGFGGAGNGYHRQRRVSSDGAGGYVEE